MIQLINILVMNQTLVVVLCKHTGKLSSAASINKINKNAVKKKAEIINKCP